MEVATQSLDGEPPRKRFKANELPLNQHQRTAIDNLVHSFKKKGEFDALRKSAYASFEESTAKHSFTSALTSFAEKELDRNHTLLAKDRRQAAPLIEGAAERGNVYKATEVDVSRMIDEALAGAEEKLRDIRVESIGIDAAAKERSRGARTDQEYHQESAVRKAAWAKKHEAEMEKQRLREIEEEHRLEIERQKKKAEEAERDRQREIEKEQQRKEAEEREKRMAEYRALKARQDAQWEQERLEKEAKEKKKREAERLKEIEEEALDRLLREGKRDAERAARLNSFSIKEPTKSATSKESALAAIMRREQLERDRKKAEASSRKSSDAGIGADEHEQRHPVSTPVPSTPSAGQTVQRPTSNVWVADGQRKPKLSYSSTSLAFKTPTPAKPVTSSGPIAPAAAPTGPAASADPYYAEYYKHEASSHAYAAEDYSSKQDYYDDGHSSRHHADPYADHRSPYEDDYRRSTRDRGLEDTYYDKSYHSSSHRGRRDDEYEEDYDHHRSHRSSRRERSRSRSPRESHRSSRGHHSSYRDRSRSPAYVKPRRRSRSRDPEGIDRYVPGSSSRAKDPEPRYRAPERRTSERRTSEVERKEKKPVEIDSYIPATSIRARARPKEYSRKSRSPSWERARERSSTKARSPSRSSRH